jgi:hypothetical protein
MWPSTPEILNRPRLLDVGRSEEKGPKEKDDTTDDALDGCPSDVCVRSVKRLLKPPWPPFLKKIPST